MVRLCGSVRVRASKAALKAGRFMSPPIRQDIRRDVGEGGDGPG
jgi:hypothetical protein